MMQSFSFQVKDVDKRLMVMMPPDFITRLPRKIESTQKYWKGIDSVLLKYSGLNTTDAQLINFITALLVVF